MKFAPSEETKERLDLPDRDPLMVVENPKGIELAADADLHVIGDDAAVYYYVYDDGDGQVEERAFD